MLVTSTLTNANLTGAVVTEARFGDTTSSGITKEQLYSTASYQEKNLQGIKLNANDLSSWDFSGQDLTGANLGAPFSIWGDEDASNLTDANLSEAILTNAKFAGEDSQTNLTRANMIGAKLTNANLQSTNLELAIFDSTTVYSQWTLFPVTFDPTEAGLTLILSPKGDFDANGVLDVNDIGLLADKIRGDSDVRWLSHAMFDVNSNSNVDIEDLRLWVKDLKQSYVGDANLNGEFNSSDMVQVFAAGRYGTGEYAGWSEGDWNADGAFDSSDMVTAFVDGGYGKGPPMDAAAVPEPTAVPLLIPGLIAVAIFRRRLWS